MSGMSAAPLIYRDTGIYKNGVAVQ